MEKRDFTVFTDEELLDLVRLNNKGAFDEIYQRYWSPLLASAFNVLKDREACKDIIRHVFSDLYIQRGRLSVRSLSDHLKVAVRKRVFKYLKRGRLTDVHLAAFEKVSFVNAIERKVNFNLLHERYLTGVEGLPGKCKEVFLLSRAENLSVKEIALRLEVSPKIVKSQIATAFDHLSRKLVYATLLLISFMAYSLFKKDAFSIEYPENSYSSKDLIIER